MNRFRVYSTKEEACIYIADRIQECITHKNAQNKMCVLGLATGSTPESIYRLLVERYKEGLLSFKNVITFNLDEYYPMRKECKASYHTYMYEHLFNHIDILPENIHILNGEVSKENIQKECEQHEQKIKQAGGIDIQLLGIGKNGHIAFNEPDSSFDSVTRCIKLDEKTIESNRIYFHDQNPEYALTMGIHTILSAKEIYLVGWEDKGEIINKCVSKVDGKYPASVLLNHPNCKFIIDEKAAEYIDCIQNKKDQLQLSKRTLFGEGRKRVVIFSPHPDDDVIGMGATFKKCVDFGHNVNVVYQTSGFCGVLDSYVSELGMNGDKNKLKTQIRKEEAIRACACLGLSDTYVTFLALPFYENNTLEKRIVTDIDTTVTINLLQNIRPDIIFCAGDFGDPHGTHELCYTVLVESLKRMEYKGKIYLYKGAWDEWDIEDVDLAVSFDKEECSRKKESILMHVSQLNKVAFRGDDSREFWERSEDRTRHSYTMLCMLGLIDETCVSYTETFKELK